MLPWSALAPFLDWRAMRWTAAHRFCLIAALTVLIFFSIARAKLIPYVMPLFPMAAVLVGDAVAATFESRLGRMAVAAPILGLIGAAAATVAALAPQFANPYVTAARAALDLLGILGLAGGIVASAPLWTRRVGGRFAFAVLAAFSALMLMAGSYGRIAVEPLRSYARLCAAVAKAPPTTRLVCYHRYVQALPFYARRRVALVGARTELGFGAAHSPDADQWFFDGPAAL